MSTTTLECQTISQPPRVVLSESRPRRRYSFLQFVAWVAGWSWRVLIGAGACLLFPTSVLVVGWLTRRMQAVTLRRWWKASPCADQSTFADFCDTLGPDAPVLRPRWLLRERLVTTAQTRQWRQLATLPWHSLWLNAKFGFQALFGTFLLTGWGCLLMLFSWEFGWLNSFNKGYEQAFLGPVVGVLGILLFVGAMFYVPMAQAHHAATGDYRALFDFRFVWRLVLTRLGASVWLAGIMLLLSLVLEVFKTAPGAEAFPGNNADMTDAEVLAYLQRYLFGCCIFLFVSLLLVRSLAARIYAGAVLKAVRSGRLARSELHPQIAEWLFRLGFDLQPEPQRHVVVRVVRFGYRRLTRPLLYMALFLVWFAFAAKTYLGEFVTAHSPFVGLSTVQLLPGVANPMEEHVNRQPFAGFANHPLVQMPCFDLIPAHLSDAAASASNGK